MTAGSLSLPFCPAPGKPHCESASQYVPLGCGFSAFPSLGHHTSTDTSSNHLLRG